jgi:photosystem II stability/assembly factor-like uncharacterized protein
MLRSRFPFAVLLLLPTSLLALDWSTHGPNGGAVAQIAVSPAAPQVVYAASGAGVFRSDDAGDSWRAVGSFNAVTQLAVDPTNADVVFATAGQSIYKSIDGGVTWRDVTDHLPSSLRPSALVIDPTNHSTIYLGSRCGPIGFKTAVPSMSGAPFAGAGVFKSIDGGATWAAQVKGLDDRAFSVCVEELSLDPSTPGHLFSSPTLTDGGYSESYDGAATWTRAAALVPGRVVADHPTLTLTRYGITGYSGNGTFLRSTDGGITWSAVATSGVPPSHFNDLTTDPETGRLFLATANGVFRSGDSGTTWIDAGAPRIPTTRVLVDRAAGYIFAATALGIVRAPIALGSWQPLTLGDPSTNVKSIASDPRDPSTVYSLISDYQNTFAPFARHGRIFVSHNGGNSWQLLRESDSIEFATIAVVDGAGDLYIQGGDGLWRYSAATGEWTQRTNAPASMLAADRRRAGYLYAFNNLFSPTFAVSSDGGQSWQKVTPPLPHGVVSVVVDPAQPSTVFALGAEGIARSTDSGMTWSIPEPVDSRLLAIAPSNPSRHYRAGYTSAVGQQVVVLFRSDDAGVSWTGVRLPEQLSGALALVVDPADAQSFWIVPGAGKIYHSPDAGITWQDATPPVPAFDLTIAADGSHLYAATKTSGVLDAPISHLRRRASGH